MNQALARKLLEELKTLQGMDIWKYIKALLSSEKAKRLERFQKELGMPERQMYQMQGSLGGIEVALNIDDLAEKLLKKAISGKSEKSD